MRSVFRTPRLHGHLRYRRQRSASVAPVVALLLVAVGVAACASGRSAPATEPASPRQAVIAELQAFQEGLGIERTGNFQRFSAAQDAVYRCYFTGLLELPASYEALQLIEPDEPSCPVDDTTHDLFFYPIEAVASGSSPVSPALAGAALERTLVVVPHEDFHNQPETTQASFDVAEAAATLVGFVAAREFASATYGDGSEPYRRLDREVDRFQLKSRIVNAYVRRLTEVYDAHDAGEVTRDDALARKAALYADFARECQASEPAASFNTCPAVMNNAGLAFDSTYTRHFPTWFEVYESLGRDTRATIVAFRRVLATGPHTEAELVDATRALRSRPSSAHRALLSFGDQ
ncbi:MAG: aminopeptidase [Acidobacteria bacterium]|nr:aminopeptidase [Acidobacteriota bacterium]